MTLASFGEFIFKHPFAKAAVLSLFGILGNVFAGAYVFEITKSDARGNQFLDWQATPNSRSFWVLAMILLLTGAYGLGMARFENQIRRALTKAEIRQRALEVLLEPTVHAVRKEIEGGKLWSIDEVMTMLSSDKSK